MQLKLSRSQRTGIMSRNVTFMLDARLDLNAEEAASVRRYGLGKLVVYNSAAAEKHREQLSRALDDMERREGGIFRARLHAAMIRLSLQVTIDSLTRGQHIECKDLDELLGAEDAIKEACESARAYIKVAKTFDGREEVIDFDASVGVAA